ncbi:serine/threonine-protein kinase [Streptomyces carpaticus]|uniref:non-specific serine/threonine protein kinase n=1 Tax=Streptomyces carpaticus TaxID=285558 RepID=A0ABV4ZPV6_9ACTN
MRTNDVVDGRYRIGEEIGNGGVATVWSAHDLHEDRPVAIKVLHPEAELLRHWIDPAHRRTDQRQLRKRFEREGKVLAELSHPGIPELYGQGVYEGRPYLVMRRIDGLSLNDFQVKYSPLPVGAAVVIATEVIDALCCAHRAGIVHRDLKPLNIVLDWNGRAHVIDFGIALPMHPGATRYTARGSSPRSMGYTAPEQLRGERITPRTDLYAIGCVGYELFVGQPPFVPGVLGVDQQHLRVPAPSALGRPGVPDELALMIDRLLAKDPDDRPAGAEELLPVLRAHLPRPGDPAPLPRLHPDPTARYREADGAQVSGPPTRGAARPARRALGRHRRRSWLGQQALDRMLESARRELLDQGPGPRCAELAAALGDIREQCGALSPPAARAKLICADAADAADGEGHEPGLADRLYGELATELTGTADARLHTVLLCARLGLAARQATGDSLDAGFDQWELVVREVAALPDPAPELLGRCRDLGVALTELGRGREAERVLGLLSPAEK